MWPTKPYVSVPSLERTGFLRQQKRTLPATRRQAQSDSVCFGSKEKATYAVDVESLCGVELKRMAEHHQEAFVALGQIPQLVVGDAGGDALVYRDKYIKGLATWRGRYPLAGDIMDGMLQIAEPVLRDGVKKKINKAVEEGWHADDFRDHGYNAAYLAAMRAFATYKPEEGTIVNWLYELIGRDLMAEIRLKSNRPVKDERLDIPEGPNTNRTRSAQLEDTQALQPDEDLMAHDLLGPLRVLLGVAIPTGLLNATETVAVSKRFNLYPPEKQAAEDATLREVGESFGGKTREWARILINDALGKLKPYLDKPTHLADVAQYRMKPGQSLALLMYFEQLKQQPGYIVWQPHVLPPFLPRLVKAFGRQLQRTPIVPKPAIKEPHLTMRTTVHRRYNPAETDFGKQLLAIGALLDMEQVTVLGDLKAKPEDLLAVKLSKPIDLDSLTEPVKAPTKMTSGTKPRRIRYSPSNPSPRSQRNSVIEALAERVKDLPPMPAHWFADAVIPPTLQATYDGLPTPSKLIMTEFVSRAVSGRATYVRAIQHGIEKTYNVTLAINRVFDTMDRACELMGLKAIREQFYADHYKVGLATTQGLAAIEKDYVALPKDNVIEGMTQEQFAELSPLVRVVLTWQARHPNEGNEALAMLINTDTTLQLTRDSVHTALKEARAAVGKQTAHGRKIAATLAQLAQVGDLTLELPINDDVTYTDVDRAKRIFTGGVPEVTLTKLDRMVFFVHESERVKKPDKKMKPEEVAAEVKKRWSVDVAPNTISAILPSVREKLGCDTGSRDGYDATREFNKAYPAIFPTLPAKWESIVLVKKEAKPLPTSAAQAVYAKFSPANRALLTGWVNVYHANVTPKKVIKVEEVNHWFATNSVALTIPHKEVYNLNLTKMRKALRDDGNTTDGLVMKA